MRCKLNQKKFLKQTKYDTLIKRGKNMNDEFKQNFFQKLIFQDPALGNNKKVVTKLWNILDSAYQNNNELAQEIIELFLETKDTIQIFETPEKSNCLAFFNVLEINPNEDQFGIMHELGHYYLYTTIGKITPPLLPEIIQNCKSALSIKNQQKVSFVFNKQIFQDETYGAFIKSLCQTKDTKYAPLSDIVSAMQLGINTFADKAGVEYTLPYVHSYSYYHLNKEYSPDNPVDYFRVFDEQFANFFAMFMLNQQEQLNLLSIFYGPDWYNLYMNTIIEIKNILKERKKQESITL